MSVKPGTEERIWAVLSHLSAIAFGMGVFLPILGWSEQRRKSKYATFQSLQALGYQSLGYTVWILSYLLIIVILVIVMMLAFGLGDGNNNGLDVIIGIWTAIFLFIMFGLFGIYFLFPIIAAIFCMFGNDFRYPIMGNRLAKYLGYDSIHEEQPWLIEDHEDHWVAAMGHFSVVILLWGMLMPIITWTLQGKRSLFLKFQSMQTLVYQAGVTLLYFGASFVYLFAVFGYFTIFAIGQGSSPNPSGLAGLVVLFIPLLIALMILLIIPLFHILGQWAGYRVFKGHDYRYPVIGKLIERRLSRDFKSSESEMSA